MSEINEQRGDGERSYFKLSICIPTYNAGRFIEDAIKSVLQQDFTDFEILVVDNASEDSTPRVVQKFGNVHYIRNKHNLGIARNWNECIRHTHGEYIYIFHADDLMFPGNLAKKVAFLDKHPRVGFVHSGIILIDEMGHPIGRGWVDGTQIPEVETANDAYQRLLIQNVICAPTVMVRRECFERLGTFSEHYKFVLDWDMWLRIATVYDVGYINEPLVGYRIHPGQETRNAVRSNLAANEEEQLLSHAIQIAKQHGLYTDELRRMAYHLLALRRIRMAYSMFRTGHYHAGMAWAWRSVRVDPTLLWDSEIWRAVLKKLFPKSV